MDMQFLECRYDTVGEVREEEGGGEGGELGRIRESDAYCPSPTSLLCHPAPSP